MEEHIRQYIAELNKKHREENTTEHSFRPALQQLLEACTNCTVINEPRRIDCGAPDFTLISNNISIAYVETKDLEDGDLDGNKKNKEQFTRYKEALDTIVFTDYLDFHLYERGELTIHIRLAELVNNKIFLQEEAIDKFVVLMNKLREAKPQRITSASRLAKLMAHRARMLAKAIEKSLLDDVEKDNRWWYQLKSFKNTLISDLTEKQFADLYAQTIAYGLFAARLHDTTPTNFSREEAAKLVPHTNPFLRKFFQYIAGNDIDKSIEWIVDDLVSVFEAVDVDKLRRNFEKEFAQRDPMIHFYEDFLYQYDPATKKQCGVYYTPQPVVGFIVRAVDDILKNDFGLAEGLADTSKSEYGSHRVQVLDPATGTGTFLAEVINRIKDSQQEGMWPSYVEEHLIPRIYGFELMMAPYTITHLKLDMLLSWVGDKAIEHKDRLKVYLTNSLEQKELKDNYMFADIIAREANDANKIKHNAPVMVVLGNPPYSGESQNKDPWIMSLMEAYKKEPGGVIPLQERNSKWINDDYCKFIRLGQDFVDRNSEGILAYICNNGFLDNPTFRGMRWSLLHSFDTIYIINLHGNSKKNEMCPNGGKDENVFDITVGTSINIFVKSGVKNKEDLADVLYADVYGIRENKYEFLNSHRLREICFQKVKYSMPFLFFVPQKVEGKKEYERGFKIDDLLRKNSSGIVTARDSFTIAETPQELQSRINEFVNLSDDNARKKYNLGKDARDWSIAMARADLKKSPLNIVSISYRPFDKKYTNYTGNTKGFLCMPRSETMRHLLHPNIAFITKKGFPKENSPIFTSESISDFRFWSCSGMQGGDYVFPLYLYPENGSFEIERRPNLDEAIWRTIENWVRYGQSRKPLTADEQQGLLGFDAEPEALHFLSPEDIFDYIYGVLHSPAYREKYKEFLKVDFPRVPYPKNAEDFEHYRYYGNLLRELHLMHNVPKPAVDFNIQGSDMVEQVKWVDNKVYINEAQYFDDVPEEAWNFYIGGYQPAQKWLKDRKGRKLTSDEMKHYEKIISILLETNKLMQEIDK